MTNRFQRNKLLLPGVGTHTDPRGRFERARRKQDNLIKKGVPEIDCGRHKLPQNALSGGRTRNGAGFRMDTYNSRLILNERFLAFPYGQSTPASLLDAAFELGKRSGPFGVDENPFLTPKALASRSSWHQPTRESARHHGAEAVAWLRGHYIASKAMELQEAA